MSWNSCLHAGFECEFKRFAHDEIDLITVNYVWRRTEFFDIPKLSVLDAWCHRKDIWGVRFQPQRSSPDFRVPRKRHWHPTSSYGGPIPSVSFLRSSQTSGLFQMAGPRATQSWTGALARRDKFLQNTVSNGLVRACCHRHHNNVLVFLLKKTVAVWSGTHGKAL